MGTKPQNLCPKDIEVTGISKGCNLLDPQQFEKLCSGYTVLQCCLTIKIMI